MKKWLFGVVSIITLTLILAACGGDSEGSNDEGSSNPDDIKQEMTVNLSTEPYSLDPAIGDDNLSGWVMDHLFEGLYTKDKSGDPMFGVAEDVEISEDEKTYTFTLREDAKWSDGSNVTADEFEYAWKRVLNPDTGSGLAFYLYYIKGAEAYNHGEGEEKDVGVQALDERTLEVELESPIGFFDQLLTQWAFHPVKKELVEEDENWAGEAEGYISNGPFKLAEWKHDSEIELEKNADYHASDEVSLETINFLMVGDATTYYQMFTSGELDYITDLPSDMIDTVKDDNQYVEQPYFGTYMYIFNVEEEPFTNEKIRKAFSMGMEREMLTENVTKAGEQPIYAMVPEGVETDDGDFREDGGEYFSEDIEEAKQLLKEGMEEEGWDTFPEVTLKYDTDETHKRLAEVVQETISKNLDVDIKLSNEEWKTFLDTTSQGDFQMARMGWTGIFEDPVVMLDYFVSTTPDNDTGWVNEDFDKLIADAKVEQDDETRYELLHEAEELLMSEMPFIPLYSYASTYMVSDEFEDLAFYHIVDPNLKWVKKVK